MERQIRDYHEEYTQQEAAVNHGHLVKNLYNTIYTHTYMFTVFTFHIFRMEVHPRHVMHKTAQNQNLKEENDKAFNV